MNFIQRWSFNSQYSNLHNQLSRELLKRNMAKSHEISIYNHEYNRLKHSLDQLKKDIGSLEDEKLKIRARFNDDLEGNVILRVVERKELKKKNLFTSAWDWVAGSDSRLKVGGHVMYFNNNMDMTWYDILNEDVDYLFKIKRKGENNTNEGEAYMLHEYLGSYKGKKLFMAKYPYAISLKLLQEKFDMESDGTEAASEKEPSLAYDARAYYNLLEHTIKRNITKGESGAGFNLLKTFKDYWIIILIIIIGCIIFLTPQGKTWLQQTLASFKLI